MCVCVVQLRHERWVNSPSQVQPAGLRAEPHTAVAVLHFSSHRSPLLSPPPPCACLSTLYSRSVSSSWWRNQQISVSQGSAQEFAKKLVDQGAEAVFKASDLDGDGTLNVDEFKLAIADQQMSFAKFEVRGPTRGRHGREWASSSRKLGGGLSVHIRPLPPPRGCSPTFNFRCRNRERVQLGIGPSSSTCSVFFVPADRSVPPMTHLSFPRPPDPPHLRISRCGRLGGVKRLSTTTLDRGGGV